MTPRDTLLLFDVHSLMNRAFYGIIGRRRLTAPDGTPTGALYAFLNMILKYKDDLSPTHIISAMDSPGDTFRHEQYSDYQAGRGPFPEDLSIQIPIARELLESLGFQPVALPRYEADDLIGTFAKKGEEEGMQVYIVTGDRDILQLISEHISVVLLTTRKTGSTSEIITASDMKEQFGVDPSQWLDVKALMGDASDNIPGVKGIGEKTALRLIKEYGSLDAVYEKLDEQKGALKKNLEAGKESAYLSRELSEIHKEVPYEAIERKIAGRQLDHYDEASLSTLLTSLGFRSYLERLNIEKTADEELPAMLENAESLSHDSVKALIEHDPKQKAFAFFLPEDGIEGLVATEDATATTEDLEELFRYLEDESLHFMTWDLKAQLRKNDLDAPKKIVYDLLIAAFLLNQLGRGDDIEYAMRAALGDSFVAPTGESLPLLANPLDQKKALLLQMPKAREIQMREIENRKLTMLCNVEMAVTGILSDMEKKGVLIDIDALEIASNEMETELEDLESAIYRDAGREFNVNSPQQLSEVLYQDLKLPTGRKSATGQYSTAADELDRLKGYHPIILNILEFRELSKLRGTFLEGLKKEVQADGRVHTSFNQTVVSTGRLSSSNPNLQNIPVRTERGSLIRELFIAPPGYLLVGADYSQVELRLLAHLSGDDNLTQAFLQGKDIHLVTASTLYHKDESEITPHERSVAKTVNFSITYGISDFGLSRDLDIPIHEARLLIERYHEKYPKVEQWLKRQGEMAKEMGYVETLFHRRRYVPELASQNRNTYNFGMRAAMNAPVQGTAADLIKMAMVNVRKRIEEESLDAELILQVHDELILEVSEPDAERARLVLEEEMENAITLDVPILASSKIGKTWGDLK